MTLINTTLSPLDRYYVTQMFRKFKISYTTVKVEGIRLKCASVDIDDIKSIIDMYTARLEKQYNANFICTKKRWVRIYNTLRRESECN